MSPEASSAAGTAERYEQVLVPHILRPFAKVLVDHAHLKLGEHVVDIGCATGAAARYAAERVSVTGEVVGVDVSGALIDVARKLPRGPGAPIEWRVHDVLHLPFLDGTVDVVLCAQTLQLLEPREPVVAEMRRILKPGGRIAVSVWCPAPENPYFQAVQESVSRVLGPEAASWFDTTGTLSDPRALAELLEGQGFTQVTVRQEARNLTLPDPTEFVPLHLGATPLADRLAGAPRSAPLTIAREVTERLLSFKKGPGIEVPFRAHIALGTTPA
jgi:ubiquinone/menaquinone biosynthesis C-methylase UbiE